MNAQKFSYYELSDIYKDKSIKLSKFFMKENDHSFTDEFVPNPFSDGSQRRPHGLIMLEDSSLAELYRLNRYFFLKSKKSRRQYAQHSHNISTRAIVEKIKKREIEIGLNDLPPAQKHQKTIDLILEYFEDEYQKLSKELRATTTIAKLYKQTIPKLSNKNLNGSNVDELIALWALQGIPKKEVPEKIIRGILKDLGLPEDKIIKKPSLGFQLRNHS